jgi:hypothetical protein
MISEHPYVLQNIRLQALELARRKDPSLVAYRRDWSQAVVEALLAAAA